ncbi:MAG: MarC family protein [Deltaproteobacteria bacterium]|nr:MAG: MarC family protein [Deltaproteobacteria bacterium]
MFHEFFSGAFHFFITAVISLFVVIDPTGNVFAFLALSSASGTARGDLAWRSCLYAFLILAFFIILGRVVLTFFGISVPAFQIAGGLILFRIAFDMIEGRGHFNRLDTSSSLVAADYRDTALVPLAMPLMAGPGAISTILVLTSRSRSPLEDLLIFAALVLVVLLSYFAFRFAEQLLRYMKESGMRLLTRIMGLILAALAVEFVIQGLRAAFPAWD